MALPFLRHGETTTMTSNAARLTSISPLSVSACILGAMLCGSQPLLAQQDWIDLQDESVNRIDAAAPLGVNDSEEKDLAVGDLNNDGWPDLVIVRKLPFSVVGGLANALFINEQGVMVERSAELAPGFIDSTDDRDVVIADVDADGWLDVITAPTFGDQPRVYINQGSIAGVWQGLQYSAADNRIPPFTPGPKFCAVAAGDVTGNGAMDLYFADYESPLEDRLVINAGNGFFTDETAMRLTPEMSESVFGTSALILDLNNDGWNDIVKVNSCGNAPPPNSTPSAVRVFRNAGSGQFNDLDLVYTEQPYMAASGDFNNDGRPDLFVVDDAQDAVMLNTSNTGGSIQFSTGFVSGSSKTQGFGGNITVADMNGDGFQDVLVSDVDTDIPGCDRQLAILQNNGKGAFSDPLNGQNRPWNVSGTFDTAVADFNQDGVADLWVGSCSGNQLFMGVIPGLLFMDGFESPQEMLGPDSADR
jgi:hypothetical protein